MDVLQLIALIGLSVETRTAFAMNCYEELSYHEKYGYGYDICCSNLNDSNVGELQHIVVYNEVRLTLSRSNFSHFNPQLFQNIPKTREVIINHSSVTLKEGSFENLHQLELLSLTSNNMSRISKDAFRNLSNLRVLNISHNNLSAIERDTLSNVQDLQVLDLSANSFESLNQIPLCEVPSLRRLFLASNKLTLTNSSIACLKLLKSLVLDFNSITELTSLAQLRYLVKVSLSHNKIEDLSAAFVGLNNLEDLNLEGNNLKVVRTCLNDTSGLKRLNLRNNSIKAIEEGAFAHLTSLEDLSLEMNNISKVPVSDLVALRRLSLSHNQLSWENQNFYNLTRLEDLQLSRCGIRKLGMEHFKSLTALKSLDLSFNRIVLSASAFNGLKGLLELNLKGNSLLALPDYSFTVLMSLRSLDLSNNKLKQLNHLTFHNLRRLESLNLSYNYLESLVENVVVPLESLSKLDLEGNRIKYIDYDIIISLLSSLKLINIRENMLSCEFLTQMLRYFKDKKIIYSINEKLSYNEENVAGIHCQEYDKFNSSFQLTGALLFNDTKLLNEIYYITKDDNKSLNASLSTTLLILGLVLLVLFISIVGISYRIYIIIKRRNGVSDEIELLDARLHKWNYI